MSDFDAAAAVSAQNVQNNVDTAVMLKAREVFEQRAEAVAGLLESAIELAEQIQSSQPGLGDELDLMM